LSPGQIRGASEPEKLNDAPEEFPLSHFIRFFFVIEMSALFVSIKYISREEEKMPIHLEDVNVASDIAGPSSALIIPCYMCPAVTVAVREKQPFIQLFSHFLKSPPFERYIETLQSRLKDNGIRTAVFKSNFIHQWFLCMWTSGRRRKLMRQIEQYDSVIVLGCDSATETVRALLKAEDGKVVQGMKVTGFMNAKMRFHLPFNIFFEDCKVIPFTQQKTDCDN